MSGNLKENFQHNRFEQLSEKVARLWSDSRSTAYDEARKRILVERMGAELKYQKFLDEAVDLLVEFQNRSMETMKDSLEWSKYLDKVHIDTKSYLPWVQKQYELIASKQRQFFDISVDKLSECLQKADWRDANDESAIVNAYLLNADLSSKPDIYLGAFQNSYLAVRSNGRCLRAPNCDLSTAESYGVTVINIKILLSIRYMTLRPEPIWRNLLFVPIGNVFRATFLREPSITENLQGDDWKNTGVILVLSILETGAPGWLYMIRDLEFSEPAAGEGETLIEGLSSNPDRFSFAEVRLGETKMGYRAICPSIDALTSKKSVVSLRELSDSGLEIVQTGMKEEWTEETPPIGLYPSSVVG